jgi:hypothetical protein
MAVNFAKLPDPPVAAEKRTRWQPQIHGVRAMLV